MAVTRLRVATPAGELSVRPERADGGDDGFLWRLFRAVKAPEADAMPLPPAARDALLRMQYESMRSSYAHAYPAARFEVAELDGAPAGRIVTDVSPSRVLYVDIAFLPRMQRQGLATALMRALLQEPAGLGVPAEVTVLAGNAPSLRLCARLGFQVVAQAPPHLVLRLG